jgi:hypothetical protein
MTEKIEHGISLQQQLEEVERELAQRVRSYKWLDKSDPEHKLLREFHMRRMQAVRQTLCTIINPRFNPTLMLLNSHPRRCETTRRACGAASSRD